VAITNFCLNFKLFFEGVQQKIQQGIKESDISYQNAYSKQELRKVISQYPAREVKKGLEHLYKKVEKHLCDEENLLQVVWREMTNEFVRQYEFLTVRRKGFHAENILTEIYHYIPGTNTKMLRRCYDKLRLFQGGPAKFLQ
jgi:hypothetical protein